MRIKSKIFKTGGIDCLETDCPFKETCANHTTAGDFRSEGGFTPEIFEENNVVFCNTKKRKSLKLVEGVFPDNHEQLGQGMIFLKDGELQKYENYSN